MKRNCEICLAADKETLHYQKFILPGEQEPSRCDVVSCRNCGAVFADNIPSQEVYDRYYRNTQKYTYNQNIPVGLIKIYQDMFEEADLVIREYRHSPNIKILDIGCPIGHLSISSSKTDTGTFSVWGASRGMQCHCQGLVRNPGIIGGPFQTPYGGNIRLRDHDRGAGA